MTFQVEEGTDCIECPSILPDLSYESYIYRQNQPNDLVIQLEGASLGNC